MALHNCGQGKRTFFWLGDRPLLRLRFNRLRRFRAFFLRSLFFLLDRLLLFLELPKPISQLLFLLLLVLFDLPKNFLILRFLSIDPLCHIKGLRVTKEFNFVLKSTQSGDMGVKLCDPGMHRTDNLFQLFQVTCLEQLRLNSNYAGMHAGDAPA